MISQRAKYALQALSYLAQRYEEKLPVQIHQIANDKKIPIKFLEAILLELKKADILDSIRGRTGGYFIKNNPKDTNLAKVLRVVDGPIALLSCASLNFYKPCENCDVANCCIKSILEEARDAILKVLEQRTLLDIVNVKSLPLPA
jgi:Rrf2 family protein